MLVHNTRCNNSRSNDARLRHKLFFFACHEQKGAGGNSLHRIRNFTIRIGLNSILVKQKPDKLYVISFQQCTFLFAVRAVLFVLRINLCNSQSNIVCIALACWEKCSYDARLNLNIFVHVVSEAPEVVLKKFENVLRSYQN